MDWVGRTADWLRDILARQSWADAWLPSINGTPDWAVVALAPSFIVLLAILVWVLGQAEQSRTRSDANEAISRDPRAEGTPTALAPPVRGSSQAAIALMPAALQEPASGLERTEVGGSALFKRASGVPAQNERVRKARVFISSTFRDMGIERHVLATQTFPALRRKFRAIGVEVQEVDLRWGVNQGDATLDICLAAVRRCNWFIGLIGQRYGTVLTDRSVMEELATLYPSLNHGLGRSLTELEIVEGVLYGEDVGRQAFFFERDPAWIETLPVTERETFEDQGSHAQIDDLKARVRNRVGAIHTYSTPQDVGAVVEAVLARALEAEFPSTEADPAEREHLLHVAYVRERLGVYVGGEGYLTKLDEWARSDGVSPVCVIGASGAGKSTLIAQWTTRQVRAGTSDFVFAHYLGASPDSADPIALMGRLWMYLNGVVEENLPAPGPETDIDQISLMLSDRLAAASAVAARTGSHIVIALDGLDKLPEAYRDLRWWPRTLPPHVRLIVSSLSDSTREAGRARGWNEFVVAPLDHTEQEQFIAETLASWDKNVFPAQRKARVLAHPLAGLPIFLKTILEELRVSAVNEILDSRLESYLEAKGMPDLFVRVLAQVESECGRDLVAKALSLIWASRAGLEEDDIMVLCEATPLAWERLRNRLGDAFRDVRGRVAFSHDFLRHAVEMRYLADDGANLRAHEVLARHYEQREPDERQAEELPYQWRQAQAWGELERVLTDMDRFAVLRERGDTELLSHWVALSAHGRECEPLLCAALSAAIGDCGTWSEDDAYLAQSVEAFLSFAGATKDLHRQLAQWCVDAGRRLFGEDSDATLISMHNLALAFWVRGELESAQKLFKETVEASTRVKGAEHVNTLAAISKLAETLADLGDLEGAQRLEEQALEARTRVRGPEHPETLLSQYNLAVTLDRRGHYKRAHDLHARVLETSLRNDGPEHPNTLTAMNGMAQSLRNLRDLEGAERLERTAFETRVRIQGADHPHTVVAMMNLAATLRDRGNLEASEDLHRQAAAAVTRTLGGDHPYTLSTLTGLAETLRRRGDFTGARGIYEKVLEARVRILGPDHVSTLSSLNNLALSLKDLGLLAEAQTLFEDVLARLTDRRGAENPTTLMAMTNLGETLYEIGDTVRARTVLETAHAARQRVLGLDHPDTWQSGNSLARCLRDIGEFDRAIEVHEQVLESRSRVQGSDQAATVTALSNLAETLRKAGALGRAGELHRRALEQRERLFGFDNEATLRSAHNLALVYYAQGDLESARALQARTLDARSKRLGLDHRDTQATSKALHDTEAALKQRASGLHRPQ